MLKPKDGPLTTRSELGLAAIIHQLFDALSLQTDSQRSAPFVKAIDSRGKPLDTSWLHGQDVHFYDAADNRRYARLHLDSVGVGQVRATWYSTVDALPNNSTYTHSISMPEGAIAHMFGDTYEHAA